MSNLFIIIIINLVSDVFHKNVSKAASRAQSQLENLVIH